MTYKIVPYLMIGTTYWKIQKKIWFWWIDVNGLDFISSKQDAMDFMNDLANPPIVSSKN